MIKTAVIGVGYLGEFHAQKYNKLDDSELIAVVDIDIKKGKKVAEELKVNFFEDFNEILDLVDAVSIVVPTVQHYNIAKIFLESNIHVLLEKPFASTIEEAEILQQIANKRNLCLQIGHLERFNPVFLEFKKLIYRPKFIENIRIAPFPKRGVDIDVVMDLMIHDIDLVLSVLGEKPDSIESTGVNIITEKIDLANARLRFPSGCIVDLTASRVSDKSERKMRIFQTGLYLSLDYGTGQARKLEVNSGTISNADKLVPESFQFERGDALLSEIKSFLLSIKDDKTPKVSPQDGINAMQVAWQIKNNL
tara:strand:+ start:837 stop:1757 length:921 start_codon:yes stop_codon:yes gene_type:complete